MMHMFFWFGTKIEDFLFQGYSIVTTWGFVSTCLGLISLAIVYEIMKITQIKLRHITKQHKQVPNNSAQPTDSSSLLSRVSERSIASIGLSSCNIYLAWLIEVVHWSFHVTLGYLLMLTVMTYNGYLSIVLVIGSGLGYYIFGPILFKLRLKNLQKRLNFRKLEQCNPECVDAIPNERVFTAPTMPENQEVERNIKIDVDVHI